MRAVHRHPSTASAPRWAASTAAPTASPMIAPAWRAASARPSCISDPVERRKFHEKDVPDSEALSGGRARGGGAVDSVPARGGVRFRLPAPRLLSRELQSGDLLERRRL